MFLSRKSAISRKRILPDCEHSAWHWHHHQERTLEALTGHAVVAGSQHCIITTITTTITTRSTHRTRSSSQRRRARRGPSGSAGCSRSPPCTASTPSRWSGGPWPRTCPRGRAGTRRPSPRGSRTPEGRAPPRLPTRRRTLRGRRRRRRPPWSSCRWLGGRASGRTTPPGSSDRSDTRPRSFRLEKWNVSHQSQWAQESLH